jgi:hypothetical protein
VFRVQLSANRVGNFRRECRPGVQHIVEWHASTSFANRFIGSA